MLHVTWQFFPINKICINSFKKLKKNQLASESAKSLKTIKFVQDSSPTPHLENKYELQGPEVPKLFRLRTLSRIDMASFVSIEVNISNIVVWNYQKNDDSLKFKRTFNI